MAYFENTSLTNDKQEVINPATEESLILLRRIAKFLEPSATQDLNQRQRIVLDAITTGLTLGTITTVSTVTTVAAVTGITNALPAGTNNLGYIGMLGDTRIDMARNTYASAIRSNLVFS